MGKVRKLTPEELKRKEHFDKLCEEMEQKGFQKHNLTVGIVKINIVSFLIMLPFVAFIGGIYCAVHPAGSVSFGMGDTLFLLVLFFVFIVLHEGIHGLTWGLFTKNHLRSISFGVIWKALTPYCSCSEPLKKWQYVLGTAMPTLILGFGLAVLAIALGQFGLMVLAVLMVLGGGGDFFIILKVLLYRSKGKETLYYDHPYECGLVVFERRC